MSWRSIVSDSFLGGKCHLRSNFMIFTVNCASNKCSIESSRCINSCIRLACVFVYVLFCFVSFTCCCFGSMHFMIFSTHCFWCYSNTALILSGLFSCSFRYSRRHGQNALQDLGCVLHSASARFQASLWAVVVYLIRCRLLQFND